MGDKDRAWRVKAWDRELGRGVVTCEEVGDLPFDAAIALVDDFSLGEEVEISVEREGESYRVTRVVPDDPRFQPPGETKGRAPALDPETERRIDALLAELPVSFDYRIASWGGDLIIEGDNNSFSYGLDTELRLLGASYLEVPRAWGGRSHRLANQAERDYLSGRHEISSRSVAVRFVDDERHVFFVVCENLEWSRKR